MKMILFLLALALSGCTVTGRAYVEHERGPCRAGTAVEFGSK